MIEGLTLEEKIASLLIIDIPHRKCDNELEKYLQKFKWGGVILFEKNISDESQTKSLISGIKRHLCSSLIAVDQEGGTVAPLNFAKTIFSGNMALSAAQKPSYVYKASKLSATELLSYGFNLVFAPVVDINNNPENPVIGVRSFGEAPLFVADMAGEAIRGYRDGGILSCAKHFPGHGDTSVDSHLGLPVINHSLKYLEEIELVPFKKCISAGVDTIMTAHIIYRALDAENPATMSSALLDGLLKKEMGFKGAIITDSMTMKAIADNYDPVEASIKAIISGADIILALGERNIQEKTLYGLVDACKSGKISPQRLDDAVTRRFALKTTGNSPDNNEITSMAMEMSSKISNSSITLIRDCAGLLPVKEKEIGVISAVSKNKGFYPISKKLKDLGYIVDEYCYNPETEYPDSEKLRELFETVNIVIYATCSRGLLTKGEIEAFRFLNSIGKKIIVTALFNPYQIAQLPFVETALATYCYREDNIKTLCNVLTGRQEAKGEIPVSLK